MNCNDIVNFMMEHSVGIEDKENLDFGVYCSPDFIYIREKEGRPFQVSKEFLMGVIFVKYDYFLKEVEDTKKDLEEYIKNKN